MKRIVPFTENATEQEAQALYSLLLTVALFQNPVTFDSIEEYNRYVEAHMNFVENVDEVGDLVELIVGDDGVTLRLSDRFYTAAEKYLADREES